MDGMAFEKAHPSNLADRPIIICGCGTIGGRVARNFAHWGAEHVILCDPKKVRDRNVRGRSWQVYRDAHIGRPKVDALAEILFEINPKMRVDTWERKIERPEILSGFVMVGLDEFVGRIAVRDSCFQSPEVSLLVEGRLNESAGRVFALDPQNLMHQDRYSETEIWVPWDTNAGQIVECGGTQSNGLLAELAAMNMVMRLWAWLIKEQGGDIPMPNDQTFMIDPVIATDGVIWR